MRNYKCKKIQLLFMLIILLGYAIPMRSQINSGGRPLTFNKSIDNSLRSSSLNTVVIQDLDKDETQNEITQLNGGCVDCRSNKFYGKEIDVHIDFFEEATAVELPDGNKVWLMEMQTEEAEGYQLIFNSFQIPEDGKLFIYNENRSMFLGSFTALNNREDNRFVTQYINGNKIYIEYFEPKSEQGKTKLELEKVVYIFDDCFSRKGPFSKEGAASCHINTVCESDKYEIEIKSTVLILESVQGRYWGFCSGVLLSLDDYNNTDTGTKKLKLLSANHCYESNGQKSNTQDWIFLFRHEGSSCTSTGSEVPYSTTKSVVGGKILSNDAGSKGSDWLLLELNAVLADVWKWDIALAGYDFAGLPLDEVVCVHHPNGDVKKLSVASKTNVLTEGYDGKGTKKDHWRVVWDKGITAAGSSGSPLFNYQHHLVGILHGGSSYCVPTYDKDGKFMGDKNSPDYFGKFSESYSNGMMDFLLPVAQPSLPRPQNYELRLDIKTIPEHISALNSFELEAVSYGGDGKITWNWMINTIDNDFGDYPNDASKRTHYLKTTSDRKCKVGPILRKAGTYKIRLFAYDESMNQAEKIIYLSVPESKADDCITLDFLHTGCYDHYYFQKGMDVSFSDYVYINFNKTSYRDACHPYQYGQVYHPKYDGVARLQWLFDGKVVETIDYNTTQQDAFYGQGKYEKYHYGETKCFNLKQAGEHTIGLKVWGGYFDYDSQYRPIHPIKRVNDAYAYVSKKILVVDTKRSVSITNSSFSGFYNNKADREIGYGNITFEPGVIIKNGDNYENIEAFDSIRLKQGVQIKAGAKFSAKTKFPPSYSQDCDCYKRTSETNNSTLITDIDTNKKVSIYPNPTTGLLNLSLIETDNPVTVQIFNTIGNLVLVRNDVKGSHTIDLSSFPKGIYFIKIHSEELGDSSEKVILQ